ncbi:hypothetical protein EX30DRAFT_12972 [Ascodesmis nigricans]|uniref:Uncharacterized protein n=1 Tax=Ascodesmis nigricans TaxID=341454 RepID=A0A4S2N6H4_9PEZI|nr:hypothetical protein EX30DRAFT_12972 [Ascodesmis nigricans]
MVMTPLCWVMPFGFYFFFLLMVDEWYVTIGAWDMVGFFFGFIGVYTFFGQVSTSFSCTGMDCYCGVRYHFTAFWWFFGGCNILPFFRIITVGYSTI